MKDLRALDTYRRKFAGHAGDHGCGYFEVPAAGAVLAVLASNRLDWEHVSVHVIGVQRCPTWEEMATVYRLFFRPEETAMQLHVPAAEHVNHHPYTLHLWRPRRGKPIPRPPAVLV